MGKQKNDTAELQKKIQQKDEQIKDLAQKYKDLESKMLPLEELEKEIGNKKSQLEELIANVGIFSEAQRIIQEKESIIEDAKRQAGVEKDNCEKELTDVKLQISDANKDLSEIRELLGIFDEASKIIATAEKTSHDVVAKAENKAKDIEQKANEHLTAANKTLKDAQTEAKRVVAEAIQIGEKSKKDAQESADEIVKTANEYKQNAYDNMQSVVEAKKKQLMSDVDIECDNLLKQAGIDANAKADAIIQAAEKYDKQIRQDADAYAAKIRTKADNYKQKVDADCLNEIDKVMKECEAERARAKEEADKIVESAREQREDEIREFDKQKKELGLEKERIRSAERENKCQEEELKLREDLLNKTVEERVKERYSDIIAERDSAQNTANDVFAKNKNLQKKLDEQRNLKLNAVETEQFKKFLELLKTHNLDFDSSIDGLIVDRKDVEQLSEKYADLQKKYSKLQKENINMVKARDESISNDEKYESERRQKEYFENMANKLLDDAAKNKKVSRDEMLQPVFACPDCIVQTKGYRDEIEEIQWLKNIKEKSEANKLYFTNRQLYAYHTAQKIRDISSIVVLAGVSGTGKSELPKNYALHGGMHFLSIPVKPDWDSPASLFGYYNSIERRFEATELLRALYQMANNEDCKNQMLMVLLDEMNLAHPEQYFADLLSKLETSRGSGTAQYDLLLGGGEKPYPINIRGNVLWTGTMNEDETTKGLSDKVIDRSTLITFPTPKKLRSRGKLTYEQPTGELLRKSNWRAWLDASRYGNDKDTLETGIEEYRKAIEDINGYMSKMSRNLGHRVWQGIEMYIRNYPTVITAKKDEELKKALATAFTDAVAFKVMPKLGGVEVSSNYEHLENIAKVIKDKAKDLATDFDNARTVSTDLFQWRSAEFMDNDPGNE